MNRTGLQLTSRVQFERLTDETDSSIGSGCGLHSKGAQQKPDDTHADGGTRNTGQEQLPSSYMIDDR
jgi:hypothetical protein